MDNNSTPNGKLIFHKNSPGPLRLAALVVAVFFLFTTNAQNTSGISNLPLSTYSINNSTVAATLKKISSIGDYVWIDTNDNGIQDGNEPGAPNVMVVLYDSLSTTLATTYTDKDGHYLFDSILVPADAEKAFMVGFYNIPPNYAYTKFIQDSIYRGSNSKADPINGKTRLFRIHAGDSRMDIDCGIKSAPGVVMPLTIDQFNGMFSNGYIQLKWTTFIETNIDHFEIERSSDGTNFRQIGRLEALGANNNNGTYTYSDLNSERGSNFYRLVMIDNEGNFTYSKTITVSMDVRGISVLVVYPNPFSKRVVVKIHSEKNTEQATIHIINNEGTVIRTQMATIERGDNNITVLNVDELPGGVYFLEVVAENRIMKTKLMKQ